MQYFEIKGECSFNLGNFSINFCYQILDLSEILQKTKKQMYIILKLIYFTLVNSEVFHNNVCSL